MRITGVESTDLFTGSADRPLQIIRVTVTGEPGDLALAGALRVEGAGISQPEPFRVENAGPAQARTVEVGVRVADHHRPGTQVPVTVIAEASDARAESQRAGEYRAEHPAMIIVAEPGWTMWMVSHFHYDPVWWSTQGQFTEARLVLPDEDGEMPDTRTAFDLVRLHLEKARRDPDYKFVLAEIDYLKPHFDVFPQDRAFVRELLATGRLELVGGTYNEPNTNLTGAEVTIRNAVYGMGFQRDVLGGDPRSAWMLDGFGHDPGFPGLMAQAGLTSSSWARGPFHQWGPEDNARMQYRAEFEWLSPDGNGVLTAYMANHYGAGWSLHQAADLGAAQGAALGQFRSLAAVAATRNVMLPVGSDHVIPARWVTDVHRSWSDKYVWPRFVTAIPREFFDAVRAEAGSTAGASPGTRKITPQTRDMNPVYTGKDVSYIDTKQAHRAGETAVLEAERLATLAWLSGAPYPAESLDKAWRLLAYGAHHDAITGTESDQVYLDLLAGWREAWDRGAAARREAIAALAGPTEYPPEHPRTPGAMTVTVVNGLARERDGMATVTVRVDEPGTPWLAVIDEPATGGSGSFEVPALAEGVTRHPDGSLAEVTLTFRASRVPALGLRAYALRPVPGHPRPGWTDIPASVLSGTAADGSAPEHTAPERTAAEHNAAEHTAPEHIGIENDAYAITADPSRGGTLSIIDKRSGQPVLRGPGNEMVLQEEHDKHPRWGEGPWHLSPKGPGTGSSSLPADVRAQRCPAGSRLLATFTLGELRIIQETLLWDGADRVEFRTHVDGSIGKDNLLRARFPALVPGGLPVYQTATAVIGRPFGFPEADTAAHWWTLDNPAHHWFGLGSVARVALLPSGGTPPRSTIRTPRETSPGRPATLQAIGVAEVITPDALTPNESPDPARALLISLAGAGVTATCSRAGGPRYGAVDVDSNVPDFRIALGGPQDNAFTAEVLAACEPPVAKRLSALVAEHGSARLWVPAARPRSATLVPDADLRAVRDLPVLIVAGPAGSAEGLASAVAGLRAELAAGGVTAVVEGELASAEALADATVALFNRGTPSGVVAPDGTLWMSLMRACSSWPAGVWIDGDRRTVPDGSSFGWQHWSHTFCYALASSSSGDWRSGGFNAAAEDYNHDLATVVTPGRPGRAGADVLTVGPPNVTLSALKPRGNPLASGHPGTPPASGEITARLRETDGRRTVARVELAGGIASAVEVDLLEEVTGAAVRVFRGAAHVELPPFGTATIAIRPAVVPAVATDGPPAPPEKVLPVHARYWLHGKGPAPAGNLPVAVHLSPSRVTLRPSALEGFDAPAVPAPGDDAGQLRLSVACGPEPASGAVELLVPDGLVAEVGDAPAGSGTMLAYSLDGGGHATWDVTVRALPGTADGRYFAGARIADTAGLIIEDTALVTVGEPGGVELDLPPEELFFRMQADVAALAGEADLEVLTPALSLAPGAQGQVKVAVTNRLGSELRGEAQLLSPFGSWEAVAPWDSIAPWIQSVRPGPGETAQLEFPVRIPATAAPGWETWLLVKLMYFGRVCYSEAIRLTVAG